MVKKDKDDFFFQNTQLSWNLLWKTDAAKTYSGGVFSIFLTPPPTEGTIREWENKTVNE